MDWVFELHKYCNADAFSSKQALESQEAKSTNTGEFSVRKDKPSPKTCCGEVMYST